MMTEDQKRDLIEFLKENLEIATATTSTYIGGMDGSGNLYREEKSLIVRIAGEFITEVYL